MTEQNTRLPFKVYESIAEEVARTVGNNYLIGKIFESYLCVTLIHNGYSASEEERQRVAEVHIKLAKIARETERKNREARKAISGLENSLYTAHFQTPEGQ